MLNASVFWASIGWPRSCERSSSTDVKLISRARSLKGETSRVPSIETPGMVLVSGEIHGMLPPSEPLAFESEPAAAKADEIKLVLSWLMVIPGRSLMSLPQLTEVSGMYRRLSKLSSWFTKNASAESLVLNGFFIFLFSFLLSAITERYEFQRCRQNQVHRSPR